MAKTLMILTKNCLPLGVEKGEEMKSSILQ